MRLIFVAVACALLTGCGISKSDLKSESGLYTEPLTHSTKVALNGFWVPDVPYDPPANGTLYVAPLGARLVEKGHEEYVPLMRQQHHAYMKEEMGKMLKEMPLLKGWSLTDDPNKATLRLDCELIRFRCQRPGLRVASNVGGWFCPIPGVSSVVSSFAEGDICIEGTLREVKTNRLLFAFKDANRVKARLYDSKAYNTGGNADANLRNWAKSLARFCIMVGKFRHEGGKNAKEFIEQRSTASGLWDRVSL